MRGEDLRRLVGERRVDEDVALGISPCSISAMMSVTTSWVRSTAKDGISSAPLRAAAAWISLARISRRFACVALEAVARRHRSIRR